jgi:hypothetical protein
MKIRSRILSVSMLAIGMLATAAAAAHAQLGAGVGALGGALGGGGAGGAFGGAAFSDRARKRDVVPVDWSQ